MKVIAKYKFIKILRETFTRHSILMAMFVLCLDLKVFNVFCVNLIYLQDWQSSIDEEQCCACMCIGNLVNVCIGHPAIRHDMSPTISQRGFPWEDVSLNQRHQFNSCTVGKWEMHKEIIFIHLKCTFVSIFTYCCYCDLGHIVQMNLCFQLWCIDKCSFTTPKLAELTEVTKMDCLSYLQLT